MTVEDRLNQHHIILPEVTTPAAAYVPYQIGGRTVYVSGQLPFLNGEITQKGHLGADVSVEQGQATARTCALNVLAHLKNACDGNLNRVTKTLKLEILVASTPDFTEPHIVANGASQVILDVLGKEVGSHARVAYGVSTLPMGVAVEVAGTFEIS